MSTPGGALAPYLTGNSTPSTGVLEPTAVSSAKSGAVFQLGQVLKTLIHNGRAFVNENDIDEAINVIDSFVGAFIPGAELPALFNDGIRAAKEDVSKRIPPGGAPAPAINVTGLDYTRLAQAILSEQRKQAQIEQG